MQYIGENAGESLAEESEKEGRMVEGSLNLSFAIDFSGAQISL